MIFSDQLKSFGNYVTKSMTPRNKTFLSARTAFRGRTPKGKTRLQHAGRNARVACRISALARRSLTLRGRFRAILARHQMFRWKRAGCSASAQVEPSAQGPEKVSSEVRRSPLRRGGSSTARDLVFDILRSIGCYGIRNTPRSGISRRAFK